MSFICIFLKVIHDKAVMHILNRFKSCKMSKKMSRFMMSQFQLSIVVCLVFDALGSCLVLLTHHSILVVSHTCALCSGLFSFNALIYMNGDAQKLKKWWSHSSSCFRNQRHCNKQHIWTNLNVQLEVVSDD